MDKYDYILVGQGIAGTMLAFELLKRGKKIMVLDAEHPNTSSMLAAGLVNPITGRHYIKSWKVDELIPVAKRVYSELSDLLGIECFLPREVAMVFTSTKMENDWLVRSAESDVQDYLQTDFEHNFYSDFLTQVTGGVEFSQGGRVPMREIVLAFRSYLRSNNSYRNVNFDYSKVINSDDFIEYDDLRAERLVFCEGYRGGMENPFFNYLPFWPAKGEVLLVRIKDYPAINKLVKHGVFIVHLHEDVFWIGSTYDREYEEEAPTKIGYNNLYNRLKQILKIPFDVLEHRAAIRPTVRDRKPFIGQHPFFKKMFIFNGMGAKGSYLSPYFALNFADALEEIRPLEKEVDIARYFKYYNA